ncbi:MAG: hypothetical protein U9Q19_04635 [Pseudomonadota bacterium]|nr:hypothetical protein [Pseudomonadota bacterium]
MPGPFIRALGRTKSAAARVNADLFEGIARQDTAVAMSGHLKTLAASAFQLSVCGFIHGPRVEDLFANA